MLFIINIQIFMNATLSLVFELLLAAWLKEQLLSFNLFHCLKLCMFLVMYHFNAALILYSNCLPPFTWFIKAGNFIKILTFHTSGVCFSISITVVKSILYPNYSWVQWTMKIVNFPIEFVIKKRYCNLKKYKLCAIYSNNSTCYVCKLFLMYVKNL